MKGKILILSIMLTLSGFTFSQSKVKVKMPVSVEFQNLKDTIFTGYQNRITLKGVSDLKDISIEMENATISRYDKIKNAYIIIPTINGGKTRNLIVKNKNQEVWRTKVTVTQMTKEMAARLKQ